MELYNTISNANRIYIYFSQVFKARWGEIEQAGPLGFAVNLFAGLIVFNIFSECIQSTRLNPGLSKLCKKSSLPLEILGYVVIGSSFFHAIASLIILIIFKIIAFPELIIDFALATGGLVTINAWNTILHLDIKRVRCFFSRHKPDCRNMP